jgi:acetyl esterase/lipase
MPKEMPNMPSQAMQDVIEALRDRRKASASQAPPTLDQRRAAFIPGDRLHPVPDDVVVTEVTAGGVPAHWLAAPGADPGRVLLFLHGGGYEFGSLRSDGELAARLGRASGMRVLSDSERLAAAAAEAGVDVTLEVGEGLPHVYQLLLGTPEAAQATEQIGTFLRARVR